MPATTAPDAAVLRELVIANRILAQEGVLDVFGHVSIRHPNEAGQYVISRSLGPELVTEADLQYFTLEGEEVRGDTRPAYRERAIHGAIYEMRPVVQAVCHNHAPSVIPFSVTGFPLRPVFHLGSLVGMDVPVWDIADEFGETDLLVRTMEQGRSLARTLGSRRVALMRGHGSVVAGNSVREVVMACVYMELNARLQLQAEALGEVRYLSAEEARLYDETMLSPVVAERVWSTWVARAGFEG